MPPPRGQLLMTRAAVVVAATSHVTHIFSVSESPRVCTHTHTHKYPISNAVLLNRIYTLLKLLFERNQNKRTYKQHGQARTLTRSSDRTCYISGANENRSASPQIRSAKLQIAKETYTPKSEAYSKPAYQGPLTYSYAENLVPRILLF